MKPRLLVITSHPIQYQAPWFRALESNPHIDLKVLFLCLPDAQQQGVGFGHPFEWDVPLLEGYSWELAQSASGGIDEGWWALRVSSAESEISRHAPDVVLITGWQNRGMFECLLGARKLGLPVMLRAESNGLAPIGFLHRIKGRWIARKADMLLPIGKANRRFYERLGLGARIGHTVPYFVDNDFFLDRGRQSQTRRSELRSQFSIPERACCFLFAGKLVPKKRVKDVLAAIEQIERDWAGQVHLLVVGAGKLEHDLRMRAKKSGLPVTFTGFLNQSEIPTAYAAADCLVLPSDYGETWGLVVNEAMACGLPAIVSDRVGCGPDLVIDGESGLRFRFGDIQDLARRMLEIVRLDQTELKSLGKRAHERVLANFSIERAVENAVKATLELVGERKEESSH